MVTVTQGRKKHRAPSAFVAVSMMLLMETENCDVVDGAIVFDSEVLENATGVGLIGLVGVIGSGDVMGFGGIVGSGGATGSGDAVGSDCTTGSDC